MCQTSGHTEPTAGCDYCASKPTPKPHGLQKHAPQEIAHVQNIGDCEASGRVSDLVGSYLIP